MAHGPCICLCCLDPLQSQKQGLRLQPLCILSRTPSVKPETSPGNAAAKQCLFKNATDKTGMTLKKRKSNHVLPGNTPQIQRKQPYKEEKGGFLREAQLGCMREC